MADENVARRPVIYRVPGMDAVRVRRDLEYRRAPSGALAFDLYAPVDAGSARTPAVVIVAGYPDAGFQAMLGCRFKDMAQVTSWARMVAASGMVAVAYANEQPVASLHALLAHVRANAADLGVDPERLGVLACSGNAALALSLAFRDAPVRIRGAALLYPMTLDLDGATHVADAAKQFGFANPGAGRGLEALAPDVPLLAVRAGRDATPGLNESLDRFVARARAANLPLALVNHPEGVHAFDLFDTGAASRSAIEQTLAFLHAHLYPAVTSVNRG